MTEEERQLSATAEALGPTTRGCLGTVLSGFEALRAEHDHSRGAHRRERKGMTEEERRHYQALAARTKALTTRAWERLAQQIAKAGRATRDLGRELDRLPPEASDG